ncbi:MAG: VacJ family lipoprotein [Burkholderiales bacterium]|nr:VacJ family lipoprotein [Burkholderiales bacterium]
MKTTLFKKVKNISAITAIFLSGCATSSNPNDPYENYNRKVFAINMTMDEYVLRPVTVGYTSYVPEPIQYGLGNFYGNLRDFVSLGNDVLQLDGINTMQTFMRIVINSTIGIFGLIDVSTSLGLPEYKNDFGTTLKTWGWTNSSYFLVPFLGPGTVRDQLGVIPDVYFNPVFWIIHDDLISFPIFAIGQLDNRAKYLGQDELLTQTLDPYATVRDLYLQNKGIYIYPTESSGDIDAELFGDTLVESNVALVESVNYYKESEINKSKESSEELP